MQSYITSAAIRLLGPECVN